MVLFEEDCFCLP